MTWYRLAQESKKRLVLMRGVSGSGKSTLAKSLGSAKNIFSTDAYFMRNGQYEFDESLLPEAHKWNINRVRDAMSEGIDPIIVDNTNRQLWEMKPYVELANASGYDVSFQEPKWHPDLWTDEGKWNVDFLANKNIHDVDRDILQEMIDSYDYNPTVRNILKSKAPWEEDELV